MCLDNLNNRRENEDDLERCAWIISNTGHGCPWTTSSTQLWTGPKGEVWYLKHTAERIGASWIEQKRPIFEMGPFECNVTQMGWGGVRFSGKTRYEGIMFNVISVTRGFFLSGFLNFSLRRLPVGGSHAHGATLSTALHAKSISVPNRRFYL